MADALDSKSKKALPRNTRETDEKEETASANLNFLFYPALPAFAHDWSQIGHNSILAGARQKPLQSHFELEISDETEYYFTEKLKCFNIGLDETADVRAEHQLAR